MEDYFTAKEKEELKSISEDTKQLALIKMLSDMKLSRERLEGTIIALLWHVYNGNDFKVLEYIGELEKLHILESLANGKQ
jgi:hypothetical protein